MKTVRIPILPILVCASLVAVHPTSAAAAQQAKDLVSVSLHADTTAIAPGKPFTVGVLLKIAPQWHVYWSNPGETGVPTTVQLHLPDGFTASPIEYPTPHRYDLPGGITMFGYVREVMLMATVTPPAKLEKSTIPISADVNYLVCDKICLLGKASPAIDLSVGPDAKPNEPELFAAWKGRLPRAVAQVQQITSHEVKLVPDGLQKNNALLTIKLDGDAPAGLEFFPPGSQALIFSKIHVETKDKTTTVTASIEKLPGEKLESKTLEGVVASNAPDAAPGITIPIDFTSVGWNP